MDRNDNDIYRTIVVGQFSPTLKLHGKHCRTFIGKHHVKESDLHRTHRRNYRGILAYKREMVLMNL